MNFSLIIPTYNRERLLMRTLEKLKKLQYNEGTFEIIVVDNNSSDNTKNTILSFKEANPGLSVRYVFEKNQGRTFASNSGIRAARYSYIVFLDDDILVGPDLLEIYFSVYKDNQKAAIVGGKIVAKYLQEKEKFLNTIGKDSLWVMGGVDWGNKAKNLQYPEIVFSGSFSLNLKMLKKDEIFDKRLGRKYKNVYLYGEDYELCLRAHLEKKQIVYEPRLCVENIVEADRLTYQYVFRRYLLAGVERYVIDKKFANKYPEHKKYRFGLPFLTIRIMKDIIKKRALTRSYWIREINNLFLAIGYYFLGPIYISEDFLAFIFGFI